MRFSDHCTVAVISCSIVLALARGAEGQQAEGTSQFRVFLSGAPVGTEEVSVRRSSEGWILMGSGHLGPPLDLTTRRLEIRYDANWRPEELTIDANTRGATFAIHTTFADGKAESEVNQTGVVKRKTDSVAADALVLPNLFFGAYEALALKLAAIPDGGTFKAYIAPQAEITVKQTARSGQRIETASRVVEVRTYALTFQNPGAPLDAIVWTDEAGRLVRFEVPAQSLLVARNDFASVASRAQLLSRSGDQTVAIPSNGFNLAGTLSQPLGASQVAKGRYPAIVLVGGSGPTDRDETVAGIPIFAQLAGAIADGGDYVLRYDKRGVGQSGGRAEAATLDDYAEDAVAAIRFLRTRKDVDPKRIVIFGHSEGAWVALLAANRDDDLAAIVLAAGPSGSGGDLVLEQQQYFLAKTKLSAPEQQARIDLQKRIQAAVLGNGRWDDVPEPLRRQADTPWFRSFLGFSPGPVLLKLKQPILILQGDLDRQVPPAHADKLATLARARKKAPADAVQVVHLSGLNHLLIPATTGDVDEYAQLQPKVIDPRVGKTTLEWVVKVLK
jgi:pimeloyl-ACP methyl ester carboxylesterase